MHFLFWELRKLLPLLPHFRREHNVACSHLPQRATVSASKGHENTIMWNPTVASPVGHGWMIFLSDTYYIYTYVSVCLCCNNSLVHCHFVCSAATFIRTVQILLLCAAVFVRTMHVVAQDRIAPLLQCYSEWYWVILWNLLCVIIDIFISLSEV